MPSVCQICEQRPADIILSLTATGASEYVCLPCMPFRVVDFFTDAGLPGLQFGFEGDDTAAPTDDDAAAVSEPEAEPQAAPTATAGPGSHLQVIGGDSEAPRGRKRRSSGVQGPPPEQTRPAGHAGD